MGQANQYGMNAKGQLNYYEQGTNMQYNVLVAKFINRHTAAQEITTAQ